MAPLLSIVVTGRNDDYGGDFHFRLQNSVRWWSHFLKEYEIPAEYIFVNWNPLPGKPSLFDTIEWYPNKYFEVKFIEVPHEIHQHFDNPAVRKPNQLYEFIAKNAGIRRAAGEYILSTNADILCDPKIFEFISGGNLKPDTFYRADRYDFHKAGEEAAVSYEEKLELIRKNVFEVRAFGTTFPFRYTGNMEASVTEIKNKNQRFLKWELTKRKYDWFFSRFRCDIVYDNAEYHVHTTASGDFMLMHRHAWLQLRAYDETFYVTLHNDAELVYNTYASRLHMQVLFYPIYHQDHERRYSDTNPELQKEAYEIYKQLQVKAQRLLKTFQPEIANGDDWGLKNFDLVIKPVSLTE